MIWIDISLKKECNWPTSTWKAVQHHWSSENAIQTPMRYHFISTRMARTKKSDNSVGDDVEKLEFSYISGGKVKWYSHSGKQLVVSQKLNTELPYDPVIPFFVYTQNNGKH